MYVLRDCVIYKYVHLILHFVMVCNTFRITTFSQFLFGIHTYVHICKGIGRGNTFAFDFYSNHTTKRVHIGLRWFQNQYLLVFNTTYVYTYIHMYLCSKK